MGIASVKVFKELRGNAIRLNKEASNAEDATLDLWQELTEGDKEALKAEFGEASPWFVV